MDAQQTEATASPKGPKKQTLKTFMVTPVHGPMHHPFQNIRIDGPTVVEPDNWVEVQIEAGKLTKC